MPLAAQLQGVGRLPGAEQAPRGPLEQWRWLVGPRPPAHPRWRCRGWPLRSGAPPPQAAPGWRPPPQWSQALARRPRWRGIPRPHGPPVAAAAAAGGWGRLARPPGPAVAPGAPPAKRGIALGRCRRLSPLAQCRGGAALAASAPRCWTPGLAAASAAPLGQIGEFYLAEARQCRGACYLLKESSKSDSRAQRTDSALL